MKSFNRKARIIRLIALPLLCAAAPTACGKISETNSEEHPQLRYTSFGSGSKTMVVVPGLSTGYVTDNTEALAAAFADFTDDYTVYVFDVRDDVPQGNTISRMGEDLVTAINDLGLKDLYMYGCSMGGMQCIYVAGTYPQLVKKVAVAASACKGNETSEGVIGSWIQLAEDNKRNELTADMGRLIYSPAFYEANKEAFSAMGDDLTDEMLTRFINTAKAIIGLDLTKEAAAIKCPVFVIGSQGDRVLTYQASEKIAEITGGQFYLYGEEYPHAVYDEAPDLRSRVKEFFDQE